MSEIFQFRWQQLARRLMEDLTQTSSVALPGVQVLARKYKVARITVERALAHLEELGVISPAQKGKQRQIHHQALHRLASSNDNTVKRVLFLSKDPENHQEFITRKIYDRLHNLCLSQQWTLQYVEIPSKPKQVHQILEAINPLAAVLFVPPSEVTEACLTLNIPVVGIGVDHPSVSSWSTSYLGVLTQAFRRAHSAGHQRIVAPVWNKPDSIRDNLAVSLETELAPLAIPFSKNYHLPSLHGSGPEGYMAGLREIFSHTPPSCVIVANFTQYLMFVSFLLQQKLSIPDDVSVILASHHIDLKHVFPSVAHLAPPASELAKKAFQGLIDRVNGMPPKPAVTLDPMWVSGDSLRTV